MKRRSFLIMLLCLLLPAAMQTAGTEAPDSDAPEPEPQTEQTPDAPHSIGGKYNG